jgi:DNA polymerase V
MRKLTINHRIELPLMVSKGQCGFPSPADPYIESNIDLNELLIINPSTTFLLEATGESMKEAGILNGDLLIVDRSLKPQNKDIVVGVVNGDFVVKRLYYKGGNVWLCSENRNYKPIRLLPEMDFSVWGVVTNAIHTLR